MPNPPPVSEQDMVPPKAEPEVQSFDSVVRGLQRQMARAQASIEARHTQRISQQIDMAGDGSINAISYDGHIVVASPDGGPDRTLRFPMVMLRPMVCHQLVSLSVEFAGTLEEVPVPPVSDGTATPADRQLMLVVGQSGDPATPGQHHVRLRLEGRQPQDGGVVEIDGMVLKRLGPLETP